jgi:hypothetical protein
MEKAKEPSGHWSTLVEGLQASPQECYVAIEEAIRRREIPGAKTSRVTYRESGVLSAERIYLRVGRKMLGFDICAAPFGKAFFFSWWQRELPASNLLGCLAVLIAFGGAGYAFRSIGNGQAASGTPLSLPQCVGLGVFLGLLALTIIGAAIRAGRLFSEDAILAMPILGAIYEAVFRPPTYYKLDTIDMYQKAVHAAVLEVVDGVMSAQGLRALAPEARTPRLRGPLGP